MRIRRTAKKYNDLLLAGIVLFSVVVLQLTMLFFNNMFFINFLAITNDIIFYFIVTLLINFAKNIKLRKTLYTVFLSFFIVLFLIDSIYSAAFSGFSSIDNLNTIGNLFIKSDIGISIPLATIIVALEGAIALFFVWFIKVEQTRERNFYFKSLTVFLAFIVGLCAANIGVFSYITNKEYKEKLEYYSSNTFLYTNFYNSYLFIETFGYINYRIRDLFFEENTTAVIEDINDFYRDAEPSYTSELSGLFEGYNLISVLCETLDTRIIDKTLTPNMASIMEDSLIFENYYAPTYFESATINTEYMALTGMFPNSAKSWVSSMGDQYKNNYFGDYSMPAQLKDAGYQTYYLHLGYRSFYSRGNFMPNMGFDNTFFVDDLGYSSNFYDIEMIDLMDGIDFSQKFFANLLTYSMHTGGNSKYTTSNPQNPNYQNYRFVKENYPNVSNETQIYYTKARMFDDFVGLLFDRLQDEGVLDNTIVLFYPDHYAYGYKKVLKDLGLDKNDKEIHHQFLTMYLPLELRNTLLDKIEHQPYKDYQAARSTKLLCSTVDLTPTLLNLLAPQSNYKYFAGNDIFAGNNQVFFSDYTVFDGDVFYDINQNFVLKNPLTEEELQKRKPYLTASLESYIETTLIHKLMLDLDYFAKIRETE